MKHCPRCKTDKPLSEYYKTSKRPGGLQSYCIPCQKEAVRNPSEARVGPRPVFAERPPLVVPEETTFFSKSKARKWQPKWRRDVLGSWGGQCAVTGYRILLVASHSKPVKKCSPAEAVDLFNGFPLVASLDALYDKGYLTFTDEGEGILHPKIDPALAGIPLVPLRLRHVAEQHKPFLAYHRQHIYKGNI